MSSQHNCWTYMCKENYQKGEKWKAKRQFKAFWKYIYWSCRSYLRIHSGMTRSLVSFDTVTFLQVGEAKKGEKKWCCSTWTEHIDEIVLQQWLLLNYRKPVFYSMFYWADRSGIICTAYTPVEEWCGNGGNHLAGLSDLGK